MKALGVTWQRARHPPGRATQMLADIGHPFARRRAGLRRDLRERAGGAAHRLPVPAGQPPRRHRARHRRPVGAGARLVHLRRRRPDVALQRQRRRAEDADPAPDPLGDRARTSSTRRRRQTLDAILATEISPELVPVEAGETPQSTEAKVGPYELQDFNLFYTLRYGFRPSKIAFLALHAWQRRRRAATGRRLSRPSGAAPTTCATIRQWLEVFLRRFFALQPVQALGDAERAEGVGRRLAVAARRLARAVGRTRRPGWRSWSGTCRS